MKALIEENAWASCTYDLAGTPQQLLKASDRAVVGYSRYDRLLTVDDRVLKSKFTCKMPAKQWGGLLALIGGIAVGVTLVLSGPVGWVALGAVAVVAIGTAAATCTHDCTDPLQRGNWTRFHTTVFVKGSNAIIYSHSLLNCGKGGVLIASETQSAAQTVSDSMRWNARLEVGVQILSNALVGTIVGHGVVDFRGGKPDLDLSTVPLALLSYRETDFVHATDYDPKDSALAGLKYSAIGYGLGSAYRIPGLKWARMAGTELSWEDLRVTALSALIGYGADSLEQSLANKSEGIVRTEAGSSAASTKTIIGVR